jgi:hypothetical protein
MPQQFSAEYVYAVTGGQEVPEEQEPGPLFTEFMDMRTAELREQGVSKELAEKLAENEWFAPCTVSQPWGDEYVCCGGRPDQGHVGYCGS